MKQALLLFLFFIPVLSIAQETDTDDYEYFRAEEDKFSKSISFQTGSSVYENEGKVITVAFSVYEGSKNIAFHIFPHERDCTEDGLSIIILTKEGSRLMIYNANEFKCDPPHARIQQRPKWKKYLLPKDFAKIRDEGIDAVRLNMHNGLFDYNFTDDQSKEVQSILTEMEKICVSRWANPKD